MKTIGCIAAVVVAVAGLVGQPARAQTPIPVDEVARLHRDTKSALGQLPKRVDSTTELVGVRIDGVTLTYQYRLDRDKANLTPESHDALGRQAIVAACANPLSRKVINAGGRYGFEFADKFGDTVMSVTMGKGDCVI
jgi:hypothetical protein